LLSLLADFGIYNDLGVLYAPPGGLIVIMDSTQVVGDSNNF